MSESSPSCPQCGAALPAESTEGLCPRCLMSQAMQSAPGYQSGTSGKSAPWQPPAPEELAPFFPQYEIQRILGRGGMGAVYLARQISLNRLVAIKILAAHLDDRDQGFAERFKNEARSMAQLSHPGIVAVYDFGQTTNGLLYIVMEYIDGTDVQQMVASQGRLHSAHAMAIIAHVCDALGYAHARGIIHRDIKPSNIMVSNDGVVKVADFGLAKMSQAGHTAGLTQSGMVMGTLHFMAPEALTLGTAVDQRADIYAVGVMLYQMLTGKLPQGLFEMPSLQVPGLDPRYDGIVAKALREDRNVRYQDASELRHDLDALMTQPVVKVEPEAEQAPAAVPPPAQAAPPARSQPQRAPGQVHRPPPSRAPVGKPKSSVGLMLAGAAVIIGAIAAFFFLGGKGDATSELAKATKDNPFVNSLGMKFVPVPDTKVLFCIHETRRQDYAAYAAAVPGVNGSWKNAQRDGSPCGHEDAHPVVNMSANDGQAFCQWLSKKEGVTYRLPTDREWSYAVGIGPAEHWTKDTKAESLHGIITNAFPWGSDYPPKSENKVGNYADTAWREKFPKDPSVEGYTDGFATTSPVMSFKSNAFGIYDLGGNVWEWCGDPYNATQNALRGGSWYDGDRNNLLSSWRFGWTPDTRTTVFGFRVVLEVSSAATPAAAVTEKPQAADPVRRAAEWALSTGGRLQISVDGHPQNIKSTSELPAVPFKVLEVTLDGKVKSLVTDESLSNLAPLTELVTLKLPGQDISDQAFQHLAGLTKIEYLNLNWCEKINGAGFEHLRSLSKLSTMSLRGTTISDAGFEHLKAMVNMESLDLTGTPLTNKSIKCLGALKKLSYLNVTAAAGINDEAFATFGQLPELTNFYADSEQITDAGIGHLKGLKKIVHLNLGSPHITGASLETLGQMTSLQHLLLNGTAIQDNDLKQLAGLNQLNHLCLWNCKVTDGGLEHFKALTTLTGVDLKGTQVTDAGVAALQVAMPKLKITR